jgi:nucleotide-binding universal stress UspA family protein
MIKPLISNIVVAISGSGASVHAAKYAIIMAKLYKCHITAVYVVDTATLRQLALSKIFIQEESVDYEQSMEDNGQRYLDYVTELAESKGIRIDTEIRHGGVSNEILATADEKKADLILMGGWEKDRPVKDIIGRGHHDVILNAKCSVIVVKEPEIELMFRQM